MKVRGSNFNVIGCPTLPLSSFGMHISNCPVAHYYTNSGLLVLLSVSLFEPMMRTSFPHYPANFTARFDEVRQQILDLRFATRSASFCCGAPMTDKPTGEIQVILGLTRLVAAGRNQAMTKMIKLLARLKCRSYACTIWCSPTAGNCATDL